MNTEQPAGSGVNDSDSCRPKFLWGVRAIAEKIGRTERQTYHLVSKGALKSVKRVGHQYVAEQDRLIAEVRG